MGSLQKRERRSKDFLLIGGHMKSVEERMKVVKEIVGRKGGLPSFCNPLKAGTLKNRDICGVITGYTVELDNLSYRGIWVSTIEDIRLTVDGEEVPQDIMVLKVKDMNLPLRDLGGHTEVFIGATDPCRILVYKLGGLAAGEHKVTLTITRRNDFGHTVGNGTEGYEEALEFTHPGTITAEQTYVL